MDPTLSPYGASNAMQPGQNMQMANLLRQLLGNQQNQPGGATPGAAPIGSPTANGQQGANQGPFSNAGNMIKGLFSPPPTSVLGQMKTGVSNLFSSGQSAASPIGSPTAPAAPPSNGLGTYEGNVASAANPAGANGVMGMPAASTSTVPLPTPNPQDAFSSGTTPVNSFGTNPASPDAMTQALMAPPNPAAVGMMPLANGATSLGSGALLL